MSKKKKPIKKSPVTAKPATAVAAAKKKQVKIPVWVIVFILLLTFVAYIPALTADFVNWDDDDYVKNNVLIKSFSYLPQLLTTPVQGNNHPLTMFTLAVNYAISGLDAWSYHLFSVIVHVIDCYLVFRLAFLLSNKNTIVAFTTAILFGIHPLHVESVAWVSERKDVLYALFFLAGLISYVKWVDTGSKKQYAFSIILLIFSLISKPAAVIFPMVLFCIDILRRRKFTPKVLLEKIPFFLLALGMGVLTYLTQKSAGTTGEDLFGMGTRIMMGFYGVMMYFLKMIVPFNQSAFYPFPVINEQLPPAYFVAPIFTVIFLALIVIFWKRNRIISFGILFYLVNLALVLQVLPVGSAVIAERYTYIPYIGLFFIIGWLINKLVNGNLIKASYIIVPVSLLFAFLTYKQASVWKSGDTLWDQAIKNQPSAQAFGNRAILLRREKNFSLAKEYYTNAVHLNVKYHEAFANRGNIYFDEGQALSQQGEKAKAEIKLDSAYSDYRSALAIKPDYHPALDNLGALFALRAQYDSALKYSNLAIKYKPDYGVAYRNRGYTYMQIGQYENAIRDFLKTQELLQDDPGYPDVFNTIGICYRSMKKFPEALNYINKAIALNPDPHFFMNRSYAYNGMGNTEQARNDAMTAKKGGIDVNAAYAASLGIK
jgi:tetratricopeptide (TPR) repeat protein